MKACQVRLARHDLQPKRASIPAATPATGSLEVCAARSCIALLA